MLTPNLDDLYSTLKAELLSGRYPPDSRITITVLAEKFNTSPIPIREGLQRLVGEGLVQLGPNGFHAMHLNEATLRNIYNWCLFQLRLAIQCAKSLRTPNPPLPVFDPTPPSDSLDLVRRQEALMVAIMDLTGNPEAHSAMVGLNQRLRIIRLAKLRLPFDHIPEYLEMAEAMASRDFRSLQNLIVRYYRRRQRLVPEILASLERLED